jgi:hypothetical protein
MTAHLLKRPCDRRPGGGFIKILLFKEYLAMNDFIRIIERWKRA